MDMNKGTLANIAGWYGAIAVIVAYGLVSFSLITSDGMVFQLLNLTGALGLLAIAVYKHVLPSVVLNIFWALIGIIAIIRILA